MAENVLGLILLFINRSYVKHSKISPKKIESIVSMSSMMPPRGVIPN